MLQNLGCLSLSPSITVSLLFRLRAPDCFLSLSHLRREETVIGSYFPQILRFAICSPRFRFALPFCCLDVGLLLMRMFDDTYHDDGFRAGMWYTRFFFSSRKRWPSMSA